jgi:hypothetical protein
VIKTQEGKLHIRTVLNLRVLKGWTTQEQTRDEDGAGYVVPGRDRSQEKGYA